MKILILGAGYLGRPLAFFLAKSGHRVHALDPKHRQPDRRSGLDFLCLEDSLKDHLKNFKPQAVVLCWAPGKGSSSDYEETYVQGMKTFLDAIGPSVKQVIYTSSTRVYIKSEDRVREDGLLNEKDPKAVCLIEAEKVLLQLQKKAERSVTILRLGGLFGPKRIPRLRALKRGLKGKTSTLNLVHRLDVIHAISKALVKGSAGIYNLCCPTPVRAEDYDRVLVQLMKNQDASQKELRLKTPLKGFVCCDKIQKELNYIFRVKSPLEWLLKRNHIG